MSIQANRLIFLASCLLMATCFPQLSIIANEADSRFEKAQSFIQQTEGKVFRDSIKVNWLPTNDQFWYRVRISSDAIEFVLVEATTGKVQRAASAKELGIPAFDQTTTTSTAGPIVPKRTTSTGDATQLRVENATAESVEVFWVEPSGDRRPYGRIRPGAKTEYGTYQGHVWLFCDPRGTPLGFFEATDGVLEVKVDGKPNEDEIQNNDPVPSEPPKRDGQSPDEKWVIEFRDHNIILAALDSKSNPIVTAELTQNGSEDSSFQGPVQWASDSKHCIVQLVQQTPRREVVIVNSSPRGQLQPKLLKFDYLKPGDDLPKIQPVLIDALNSKATIIDNAMFPNHFTEHGYLQMNWAPKGKEFYFDYNQRGHQLYRILAVDADTGVVRTVVEEQSNTAIEYNEKTWREWLHESNELLWMSERTGWAQLWLVDIPTGTVKNRVTNGDWVVREVLNVDSETREVFFIASGIRSDEDPYHQHLCRCKLDGTGFVQLTQGDGDHRVEFSPDRKYFIDRWSRINLPPITELRSSVDGRLVCELERADISALTQAGWTTPERFVAKGRDGKTDIYGMIIKPSHFDPSKKYPVVEEVYAGPHGSFTPKQFGRLTRQHVLAELGFIVVQADGMGTDNRGKAFHDVSWKNLEDGGFPDRIAWLKAAALERPWMDLSRVGIYGGSAGGQNAMRALIDHHDFYKVAIADCGCHDNRMDKIWWNEQWLSWPIDESYVRASNVEHAHRMQGKLLLIVGELDTNVDPASTLQVVNALQKAQKDFEFMPIVGVGHGAAETPFGNLLRMKFLTRYLIDLQGY